jgi:hypothetical protein
MKVYVRERLMAKEGGHQPRFRVVATEGTDLRIHVPHLRRPELEKIATDLGAQIIYLEREESPRKPEKKKMIKPKSKPKK